MPIVIFFMSFIQIVLLGLQLPQTETRHDGYDLLMSWAAGRDRPVHSVRSTLNRETEVGKTEMQSLSMAGASSGTAAVDDSKAG